MVDYCMFPTASVSEGKTKVGIDAGVTALHTRLNRDDYAELWQLLSGLLPILEMWDSSAYAL